MKQSLLVLFLILFSVNVSFAQKTTEEMKEFANGSYLQIDNLDVPKGIKRVEEQLRENVIDVIIHSKIHMPIFAQKRPAGYSKEYKKFYGINIRILPIIGDEDFYSLQLFYYNWTTNKFDKKLVKKISRYNVLNELRFATYEIIMGKQWVMDHKDQIENRNFERIQAVRDVISQNERMRKKKQKEEEKKKKQLEEENEKKRIRNLLKREEREKKNKKEEQEENDSQENDSTSGNGLEFVMTTDPEIEKMKLEENQLKNNASSKSKPKKKMALAPESEMDMEGEELTFPESSIVKLPKKTYLYGFANYFQEDIEIGGIIETSTTLKYFGVGGKFILESQDIYPRGMRFSIQAATPIFKEKYKFPIYRAAESEYFISKLLGHVKFFAGLDFVPVYFVGLPEAGAGFQVYENDFLWGKIGAEVTGNLFEHSFELRAVYSKSLVSKSNQEGTFDATKLAFSAYSQIKNNHGAELNISSMNASGPFSVVSKKIALSYVYKFEN